MLCGSLAKSEGPEIAFVKLRIFADLSSKKSFSQRTEWNEADSELLQRRDHFLFRFSPPQRIFTLERGDGLNCVGATNGLHGSFRKSEVCDFALLDGLLHGSGDVFNGNVRIDAVLVEKIDDIGPESLERGLRDFFDMFRPTVQPSLFAGVGINFEPELGGDHHLLTERSERFTHEFFIFERTVHFGGIEEGDAEFHGRSNQGDPFVFVQGGP